MRHSLIGEADILRNDGSAPAMVVHSSDDLNGQFSQSVWGRNRVISLFLTGARKAGPLLSFENNQGQWEGSLVLQDDGNIVYYYGFDSPSLCFEIGQASNLMDGLWHNLTVIEYCELGTNKGPQILIDGVVQSCTQPPTMTFLRSTDYKALFGRRLHQNGRW